MDEDQQAPPSSTALSTTASSVISTNNSTTTADDDDDDNTNDPIPSKPHSRLTEIWKNHLDQYRKMDHLEKQIDEHAARLRRRVTNLLETTSTHRLSHLRLFVSHHVRSATAVARLEQLQQQLPMMMKNEKKNDEDDEVVEKEDEPKEKVTGTTEDPLKAAAAEAEAAEAKAKTAEAENTVVDNDDDDGSKKWTLVVEGKLLIGHLDHESARSFDERLRREFRARHQMISDSKHPSMALATSASTSNTVPSEEEDPIDPIRFTHFFDKMVVQFQSVYQPAKSPNKNSSTTSHTGSGGAVQTTPKASTNSAAAAGGGSSSKKKSRSAKRQKTAAQQEVTEAAAVAVPEQVDPRLLTYSDPTEFVWNKTTTVNNSDDAATTNADNISSKTPNASNKSATGGVTMTQTTPDAHAFHVHYNAPAPPSLSLKHCGVIATAQLYPTRGPEQRYKPSKDFAKAFFPKHIDAMPPPVLPTVAIAEAKRKADEDLQASEHSNNEGNNNTTPKSNKRKAPAPSASATAVPAYQTAPNALDNEIHVPSSLTMKEITTSLFTYIQDKKLATNENDPTLIHNDKILQTLFGRETMHFHELQSLLMQQKLILLLPKPAPITFKYVILADTPEDNDDDDDDNNNNNNSSSSNIAAPMTMDLHNDVYVPNLFPNRARECLRRIKRRELEYTSSRTKGRYLLMASRAKDESAVKMLIEEAICGGKPAMGDWHVLACLAKAAPAHSEARTSAMLDAKIAYLLQQVEQSQNAAQQAWDLVDALLACGQTATEEEQKDHQGNQVLNKMEMDDPKKEPGFEQGGQGGDAMDVDNSTPVATNDAHQTEKAEETTI